MKRITVAMILVLILALTGIALAQKSAVVIKSQAKAPAQAALSAVDYATKMLDYANKTKNILNAKFMYSGKEVSFLPKTDKYGNPAAVSYYAAEKNMLGDIKTKISALAVPAELTEIQKMFQVMLDNAIASFSKAIESLQQDSEDIMVKEVPLLTKKAQESLSQVMQKLQEIKMRN